VLAAGLRVSAPACAWGQLAAAGATLEDLVVVADGILARYGPAARNTLEQQLEHSVGRRGVTRLREALGWACPGTDSAPESVLRMRFVLDGLPVPAVNHTVIGPDGAWLHRPDLCLRGVPARLRLRRPGALLGRRTAARERHGACDQPGRSRVDAAGRHRPRPRPRFSPATECRPKAARRTRSRALTQAVSLNAPPYRW
jgi:hypothetical protein